jgi:hypothetical protein
LLIHLDTPHTQFVITVTASVATSLCGMIKRRLPQGVDEQLRILGALAAAYTLFNSRLSACSAAR